MSAALHSDLCTRIFVTDAQTNAPAEINGVREQTCTRTDRWPHRVSIVCKFLLPYNSVADCASLCVLGGPVEEYCEYSALAIPLP